VTDNGSLNAHSEPTVAPEIPAEPPVAEQPTSSDSWLMIRFSAPGSAELSMQSHGVTPAQMLARRRLVGLVRATHFREAHAAEGSGESRGVSAG